MIRKCRWPPLMPLTGEVFTENNWIDAFWVGPNKAFSCFCCNTLAVHFHSQVGLVFYRGASLGVLFLIEDSFLDALTLSKNLGFPFLLMFLSVLKGLFVFGGAS